MKENMTARALDKTHFRRQEKESESDQPYKGFVH